MRKLIKEIQEQPHHVRHLATVLCTIAVVAVVVLVWFRSFQHDMYALLNPEPEPQAQDQAFAQQSKSLFSSILQTFDNGRNQISNIFTSSQATVVNNTPSPSVTPEESTHPLPVSGNR